MSFNRLNSIPPAFANKPPTGIKSTPSRDADTSFVAPLQSRSEWEKRRLAKRKLQKRK